MSHPARGPARSAGIDGKANAQGARRAGRRIAAGWGKEGARMSHPTRAPRASVGIGGKANARGARRDNRRADGNLR